MGSRAPRAWAAVVAGLGLAVAVVAIGWPAPALGKASYSSPYGYDRTWDAAVRLVRVDNGWKIEEKDDAAGYILFEYKSPESIRPTRGSLELVRGRDADSPVSVLAVLAQMPHYHEQLLIDALASKMRREYGEPPAPRRPLPPPTPPPEADAGPPSVPSP